MSKFKSLLLAAACGALVLGGLTLSVPGSAAGRSPDYGIDGECVVAEESCRWSKGEDDIIRSGVRYCYYGRVDCPECTPCGPKAN